MNNTNSFELPLNESFIFNKALESARMFKSVDLVELETLANDDQATTANWLAVVASRSVQYGVDGGIERIFKAFSYILSAGYKNIWYLERGESFRAKREIEAEPIAGLGGQRERLEELFKDAGENTAVIFIDSSEARQQLDDLRQLSQDLLAALAANFDQARQLADCGDLPLVTVTWNNRSMSIHEESQANEALTLLENEKQARKERESKSRVEDALKLARQVRKTA